MRDENHFSNSFVQQKKKNFINIVREPAASRNRFFKNPCHDLFNALGITTAHPE